MDSALKEVMNLLVRIMNKNYQMRTDQAKALLNMSKEYCPFGIYAVEKDNQIEMMNLKPTSRTQLKKMVREYRLKGFKVYSNGL